MSGTMDPPTTAGAPRCSGAAGGAARMAAPRLGGAVGRVVGWWELQRSDQTEGDDLFGETTIACPTMNLVWRNDDRRGNATYDRRWDDEGKKKVTPLFSKQR